MFYGTDSDGSAAAIFSLATSCRMHRSDPQQHLDESECVLPDWPNDRHLETIAIASFHPSALASDLKQTLIAELDSFLCGFTIPRAASTLRGGQRQRDGGAAAVKMALVQRLRFNAGPRS